jgi:uncharacterized membrane protein YfcA
MPIEYYFIAALGSLAAGFINTLAGSGSAITMSILMFLVGLPAKEASATIRVSILAMTSATIPTFYKQGKLKIERDWLVILCMTIGGIGGIITLLWVDNAVFKEIFKYFFVIMLIIVLMDTKSWLKATDPKRLPVYWVIPLYLMVGFYGGFIQMGVGVFFLVVTVLGARYNIIDAAGMKLASIGSYTIFAVAIFAANGLIHWDIAAAMAVGEIIGGRLGARFATRNKKAAFWAHRLLVIALIVVVLKAFEPWKWFG